MVGFFIILKEERKIVMDRFRKNDHLNALLSIPSPAPTSAKDFKETLHLIPYLPLSMPKVPCYTLPLSHVLRRAFNVLKRETSRSNSTSITPIYSMK
jgi:hypothetical protein